MQFESSRKNILYGVLFLLTLLTWFFGYRFLYLDVRDPQAIFLVPLFGGIVILSIIFAFLINDLKITISAVILFWIIFIFKVSMDAGYKIFAVVIFDSAILIAHIFIMGVLFAIREFIVSKLGK